MDKLHMVQIIRTPVIYIPFSCVPFAVRFNTTVRMGSGTLQTFLLGSYLIKERKYLNILYSAFDFPINLRQ